MTLTPASTNGTTGAAMAPDLTVPLTERELNAAILVQPDTYALVCDLVSWSDYADPTQRRIARAIWLCVQDAQNQIPPIAASSAITYGALQACDPTLTNGILRSVDDAGSERVIAMATHHAQVIRHLAQARRAVQIIQDGQAEIQQRPHELTSILAGFHSRLADVQTLAAAGHDGSLRAAFQENQHGPVVGIPTGFMWCDHPRFMGGLKLGRILCLVGREKGRKSTIAQQMCLRMVRNRVQGTYYTYDGTWLDIRDSLVAKLATAILRRMDNPDESEWTLKPDSLHDDLLTERQRCAVAHAREQLGEVADSLWILDKRAGISDIDSLEREIRRGVRDRGDRYVVIDYVQDITCQQGKNERETVNHVVSRLDVLCRSLGTAHVWISQRSEENNRRASDEIAKNTMPSTVGTKDSKKVTEAADYVALVHYDQINHPDWVRVGFWGGRYIGATPWHAMRLNRSSGLFLDPLRMPDWT